MAPDYNILVIGMGNIGKFLLPGYRKLLGDKVETNVFGVRNNPDKVAELQAIMPFAISAGNTAQLLREKRPDIVIVSTPPKVIPDVIENDLKPYFAEAREKGWNLPDIYTFGPTPAPSLYLEKLGNDVNVVKFLPSMAHEKNGVPLEKLGAGFLVFGKPFPKDREERAFELSNMFSQTFAVTQEQSLLGLASKTVTYTNANNVCTIADALKDLGIEADIQDISSVYRAAFRSFTGKEGDGLYPCSAQALPEQIGTFVRKLSEAWYKGILRYIVSENCPEELGRGFLDANFEVFALAAQLSTREELDQDTARRATKGGVTEKSMTTWGTYFRQPLYDAVKAWMNGTLNESFFDSAEGVAYMIDMTVNRHAYRLANK